MNVLITGAASGIGLASADYFIRRGHTVFGIDVTPAPQRENFHGFIADITDETALMGITECLLKDGIVLDVIVNVAGVHMMASLVESDCSRMKKVVEVNLWGTVLTNRIFHRCLSESGRIVIVTSEVAGLDPMPFNGLYSAAKTGLDCYAQALRQELNLIGQRVVTVRPGAVQTQLSRQSVKETKDLADYTQIYKKQAKSFSGLAAKFMGKPIEAEVLAVLIYKAATAKHPKLIYKKHQNPGLVLMNVLPKRWQCALVKLLLKLQLF